MFIDEESKNVTSMPKTFLLTNGKDYFVRRVSLNTKSEYYSSCENEYLPDEIIKPGSIEIIGELKGVLNWNIPNS